LSGLPRYAVKPPLAYLYMMLIFFSAVGRLFTEKIAEYYESYYTSKGVTFTKGTVLTSFEKDSTGKVSFYSMKLGLLCS
jgi:hypothetical protein